MADKSHLSAEQTKVLEAVLDVDKGVLEKILNTLYKVYEGTKLVELSHSLHISGYWKPGVVDSRVVLSNRHKPYIRSEFSFVEDRESFNTGYMFKIPIRNDYDDRVLAHLRRKTRKLMGLVDKGSINYLLFVVDKEFVDIISQKDNVFDTAYESHKVCGIEKSILDKLWETYNSKKVQEEVLSMIDTRRLWECESKVESLVKTAHKMDVSCEKIIEMIEHHYYVKFVHEA